MSDTSPDAIVAESASPAGASAQEGHPTVARRSVTLRDLSARYGLVAVLLATVVVFSLARPETFATLDNAKSILQLAAPSVILAVALTFVLIMQDFDLSFGAMIGLGSGLVTVLIVRDGVAWPVAILLAGLAGVAVGVANGYLVAVLNTSSFIITLAMGTLLTGVEYAVTDQDTIVEEMPAGFTDIAQQSWLLGLNNVVWLALVVTVIAWVVLSKTEYGRYVYALGGNREAARLAGVRVRFLRVGGFVIVAVAAAAVGVLLSSMSASYTPNVGPPYLLPGYAAVFLGAAAFRPGQFNVLGTVVGVLLLGVIQTGLTMLNLETFVISLVQGGILIAAVLISRFGAGRA
jgi:ribose transport system permease protein